MNKQDGEIVSFLATHTNTPAEYIESIFENSQPLTAWDISVDKLTNLAKNIDTHKKKDLNKALRVVGYHTGKSKEELMSLLELKQSDVTNNTIIYEEIMYDHVSLFQKTMVELRKEIYEYVVANNIYVWSNVAIMKQDVDANAFQKYVAYYKEHQETMPHVDDDVQMSQYYVCAYQEIIDKFNKSFQQLLSNKAPWSESRRSNELERHYKVAVNYRNKANDIEGVLSAILSHESYWSLMPHVQE